MAQLQRIPLPVVAGPTASGKTGLAVALAKKLNGEVVSADSMQIYRELSIGTARPTEEEMQGIPHHLMGFLPLEASYSVARYTQDAKAAIDGIWQRKKQPILCGGTGLYIQALTENLQFQQEPAGGGEVRRALQKRARREGGEALLRELAAVDPRTAERLHPNDVTRIVRALELTATTGITMSEQYSRSRREPSPYEVCLLVLDVRDRAVLYDRINRRVEKMAERGLLEEARRALCLAPGSTALQAIGYKELAAYFSGGLSLEETLEHLKRQTRRYAKRQLTWFHRMSAARFLYIDEYEDEAALQEAALRAIEEYFGRREEGERG